MTKTIVVTGATGKIGAAAVERLVQRGHRVRAVVHSKAGAQRAAAMGATPYVMDLSRHIDAAPFTDADSGLLVTPVGEDFEAVSKALIDAAKVARLGRVVRISIDSEFIERGAILGIGHGRADEHLTASGLRHTILRPSGFMQNFLGMAPMVKQGVLVAPTGDGAVPFIDSRDIADAAVAVLTDQTAIDGPVDISGPEALTFADVAHRLSARLGRSVSHVSPSADDARAGLAAAGFEGWLLEAMLDDTAHVAAGHGARVRNGIDRLTERQPRRFDAFLDEHIAAFKQA